MRNRALSFWLPVSAAALLLAPVASAVSIDWVYVGNPGNPADAFLCDGASCGSVGYDYYVSKYEVTNAQYAEFLNAKAATDTNNLYNPSMNSDGINGGITQSGSSGSYSYSVKTGFANKPVTYVNIYDSMRFANWLNNGQGDADTEMGAYTITLTGITNNTITREALANTFLPSEDEWYKAAYYSPDGIYFFYPAGTSTATVCAAPTATANRANCEGAVGAVTDVGAYMGSASPYGTYDQGGNVFEWNERIVNGTHRRMRGGSALHLAGYLHVFYGAIALPMSETEYIGFRVATLIPEPSTGLLVMTGLLGLAYRQRRRPDV